MIDRIYLEITNVCNLDCTFCHKTKREKKLISKDEFDLILNKIEGEAKHLYFHIMGEPTLHPDLYYFIKKAKEKGFLPCITTNGSLLSRVGDTLAEAQPHRISISLHAPDANPAFSNPDYYKSCVDFAKKAAPCGCFVSLRLWNLGTDADNTKILEFLHSEFKGEWEKRRNGQSYRLDTRIFLEWGEHFEWPDPNLPECPPDTDLFCYALRDQVGILVDGTVVPCCLDSDGNLPLGNIYKSSLSDILSSERARGIYNGFTCRRATESLCRKCGFAKRFSK